MQNGKATILSRAQIEEVARIFETKLKRVKILKGTVVCNGKVNPQHQYIGVGVKGRVVIAPSGSIDVSKIIVSRGDVLVTSMTTPNMAPLVKNAVAVVTDEGGVLCHAAIIARELNKPCIVGTKIATQVLKDGDMVEVDANKGVVKIIDLREK